MPQNLPRLRFPFTTTWRRTRGHRLEPRLSPALVNTASLAMSRLAMSHFARTANTNDIVGQLGITGVGFGGPGAWGAPYFNVQGYSPSAIPGRHSHAGMGHGRRRPRHAELAEGRHSLKFGGSLPLVHLADVGLLQSRGYYPFTPASPPRRRPTTAPAPRWRAFCSDCPPCGSSRTACRR